MRVRVGHGGWFSLDATVRIEANDRRGRERLFCGRILGRFAFHQYVCPGKKKSRSLAPMSG
jgi:hypothetical protein